ncbi:MAG TPA: hypothetical protein ENN51_07665 [candidate division WOR-3 bacterium]|uniref:Uncharacterized protein n=1 Tax=candidate division WOR-3 bacterium TaxID=2052148 RepID=A0A7V0T6L5_UNCW3|nr:hypothetical protein [candidate division WOR-3 bacterium]
MKRSSMQFALALLRDVAQWAGAGVALCALVAVGVFGCGRMPPEGFWEPTADDSAAIYAWVDSNLSMFSAAFNDDSLRACDTVMPGTTGSRIRNEVRDNPFKQRFRHNALQHVFHEEGHVFKPSFIAVVDTFMTVAAGETTWTQETTATVTVVESLPGELRLKTFSYTKYLRDSMFFPSPGETLILQYYEQAFSPFEYTVRKEFVGAQTDGAVLKKVDGTWQPWKYAGGSRFFAPNPNDAPYVVYAELISKDTTVRVLLRPDTVNYGMQRLYTNEELPTFRVGDSLTFRQSQILTTIGDAAGYVYFQGKRYEFLTSKSDRVPLTEPGVFTIYAVQIPIEVTYEVVGPRLELDPEVSGNYVGTVWGVRVRVVE